MEMRMRCPGVSVVECRHCSKAETKEDIIDVRLMTDWDPEELWKCQQEDPDLKCVINGLQINKRPTREEIATERIGSKAYWAQWNSLKLVSGCLHRVWESEDGQSSRALIIVLFSNINIFNRDDQTKLEGSVANTDARIKQNRR